MKKTEQEKGFEQALARLDQITRDMESGRLNLDDLIDRFEEGQKLLAFCGAKLNDIERRIEKLVKKDDTDEAVPFLEDETTGDAASESSDEDTASDA